MSMPLIYSQKLIFKMAGAILMLLFLSTHSTNIFASQHFLQRELDEKEEVELLLEQMKPLLLSEEGQSQSDDKFIDLSGIKDKVVKKILNFDTIADFPHLTIYRSSLLGKRGLSALYNFMRKNNLPFPKTIIYMNKQGYNPWYPPILGDFAIEEFLGQEEYGYRFFHSFDYQNRTYVDGHNPYEPSEDIDTQSMLLSTQAIDLFGNIQDSQNDGGMDAFLRVLNIVLDENNSPVLFHCFGGRHRTGMVAMAIRYLQGGHWVNGEKKSVFIPYLGKTLVLNPAQYEYYQHNKELLRQENLDFIEKFAQDPRFKELKERHSLRLNEHNSVKY